MTYVETNCVVEHNGRQFESGGAVIADDYVIGYLGKDGVLTDWHGNAIGTYKITSSWRTPMSCVSSCMCQVDAQVNGVWYTGRSGGIGLLYRGKRKARQ